VRPRQSCAGGLVWLERGSAVSLRFGLPHHNRARTCKADGMSSGLLCPECQSLMDEGVVVGRSPGVKFKGNRDLLGDLGGVLLTSGLFNHSVAAMRCNSCGTVVIPGNSPGAT